jgi:hypothetical protein
MERQIGWAGKTGFARLTGKRSVTTTIRRATSENTSALRIFSRAIRAAVPDVTLEEICVVRWEDEKLLECPGEIELEHASCCLQVPTGYPTDPDLIGPFASYAEAEAFTEAHPVRCKEAYIRCMGTPAFEILCEYEAEAERARLVTKLGLASNFLKPREAPRDMIIEINATVAREVAQYLERNCPLPNVQEMCTLLRTLATADGVTIYARRTRYPPEPRRPV